MGKMAQRKWHVVASAFTSEIAMGCYSQPSLSPPHSSECGQRFSVFPLWCWRCWATAYSPKKGSGRCHIPDTKSVLLRTREACLSCGCQLIGLLGSGIIDIPDSRSVFLHFLQYLYSYISLKLTLDQFIVEVLRTCSVVESSVSLCVDFKRQFQN